MRNRLLPSSLRLLLVAALAGCASAPGGGSGNLPGAAAPRVAVEQFLAAVRATDVQAMTAVWGTARGSVRETIPRDEVERRAIILQCFLAHDQFRILGEIAGEGGRRIFRVAVSRGDQTRQPSFHTIEGPNRRWYVENVELAAVRDFCGDPMVR